MEIGALEKLLSDDTALAMLQKRLGTLNKADTIEQATNLLYHDVSTAIQMLYPYKQLTPFMNELPRVRGEGSAFSWKRITSINTNGVDPGVSEGNRGARIALAEQDLTAAFKVMGLESSVTFEARLGGRQLTPETIGMAVYSQLRALRIEEEKAFVGNNATMPLGTTPTPTLTAAPATGGLFNGTAAYVACVALTGVGVIKYRAYSSVTTTGGVRGRITKVNADGSSDTYGGGSAAPSSIANITATGTQCITATVTVVPGAAGYAWYVGSVTGAATMYLAGITPSNQAIFTDFPASTNQPMSALLVSAAAVDNSTNTLEPDGFLVQMWGAAGPDPGRVMATTQQTVAGITYTNSGSIKYAMATANTGLTIDGSDIAEFDAVLEAAWEQYLLGYDYIVMNATDMLSSFGTMLNRTQSGNAGWRMLFDADETTGRIVAGRKVTTYMNKFTNMPLDIMVHPYCPRGTIVFWSKRVPYEVSGLGNLIEAKVRQDYYQIQWPWSRRAYEFGVYVDETWPMYFAPGFAMITNVNPVAGSLTF